MRMLKTASGAAPECTIWRSVAPSPEAQQCETNRELPNAFSRADLPQAGDKKRMEKINLAAAIAGAAPQNALAEIAQLNDARIKVGRFKGRFAWHSHEREDELFFVVRGRLTLQFRGHDVILDAGEMLVVPAGVEHRSAADDEAHVLVIHPATTVLPSSTDRA